MNKEICVTHSTESGEFRVTINGSLVEAFSYDNSVFTKEERETQAKVCAFDCAANEQFPVEILSNKF